MRHSLNIFIVLLTELLFGNTSGAKTSFPSVRPLSIGSAWVKTNETRFIYDGYLLIQERDTNNNVFATYTCGLDLTGDLQNADGIGSLLARTDANGSFFYHSDAGGNVTALMDARENITARYLYGPFGKPLGQWGPMASANSIQYSSKSGYKGIVDFGFRWYDPDVDRKGVNP